MREVRFWFSTEERITTFAGQIHQESGWDPEAKSKYASGLAQFTPDTAEWISRLYPVDLGSNQPLDVKWALRALCAYDKFLWDKFPLAITENDRWAFTLSSYNSGYGWTLKERKSAEAKGKDPDQWWCSVEHEVVKAKWAFEESRNYVEKILKKWKPFYEKQGW